MGGVQSWQYVPCCGASPIACRRHCTRALLVGQRVKRQVIFPLVIGTARGRTAFYPLLSNRLVPVENLAPSHEHHPGKLADVVENHIVVLDAVWHASDVRMR